jgi:hypothetical protein
MVRWHHKQQRDEIYEGTNQSQTIVVADQLLN